MYVDDCILLGPDENSFSSIIQDLRSLKFDIEEVGQIKDYLGVEFTFNQDKSISLAQPHLIDQILQDLQFNEKTKTKDTPAASTIILGAAEKSPPHDDQTFNYKSVIGKLNFLEKSTRPDIAYAVHQCARFSSNPRTPHSDAVRRIGRYLQGTRDKGLIFRPDPKKGIECWADADFSGNWDKERASFDASTARSRSGYVITYAGCPLLWASKIQTEIALSTTEAEYISLSQSLREVISLMSLTEELKENDIPVFSKTPVIKCKVFEDNSGAVELARLPKVRPRTKHLNIKWHHFRQHVAKGLISVFQVTSVQQLGDMFTKPLPEELFQSLCQGIMGW